MSRELTATCFCCYRCYGYIITHYFRKVEFDVLQDSIKAVTQNMCDQWRDCDGFYAIEGNFHGQKNFEIEVLKYVNIENYMY